MDPLEGLIPFPRAVAAVGGEGIGREGDLVKEGAGVLGAAAGVGAALLGGDGVVQDRHDQLGRTLQTDDGELAQGDEEPLLVAAQHQIVPEHGLDIRGDGQGAWLTDLHRAYPAPQHHRIQHLHHCHQFAVPSGSGAPKFAQLDRRRRTGR